MTNPNPKALILDLMMPIMNGMEVLEQLREIAPHVPVIMLTAHGDVPSAVESPGDPTRAFPNPHRTQPLSIADAFSSA